MPSGWDVYYVVFLSAVLALGIPAALALISLLVAPKRARDKSMSSDTNMPGASLSAPEIRDSAFGRRINTRFFLGANAALILITMALVLVPCVGILGAAKSSSMSQGELVRTLICVVTIAGFAAFGLLYSARKGDLNWLHSFRRGDEQ